MTFTPANGFTAVPTNVLVTIQFSEPIQSLSIDQVTFSTGGVNVNVNRILSNSNQTLILKPLAPLAGTRFFMQINGISDLAGQQASLFSAFTTGSQ